MSFTLDGFDEEAFLAATLAEDLGAIGLSLPPDWDPLEDENF